MAEKLQIPYQRLPGSGYRQVAPMWVIVLLFFVIGIFALLLRGRRVLLWLGADHLLVVESDGYREYYKRFHYEDIQMLTIRKTLEGRIVSALLGAGLLMFAGVGVASSDRAGMIALLSVASLFGMLLLVNFLLGPTCQCVLQTAVQVEELPSLGRWRQARRALAQLRPRIEAAQGVLTREEITAGLARPQAAPPVIAAHWSPPAAPEPLRHYQSKVHFILCCLLLADLPLTACDEFFPSTAMTAAGSLFFMVIIGFGITALIKQRNTDLPRLLKNIPWLTLGSSAVLLFAAIAYGVYLVINDPQILEEDLSASDDPILMIMTLISTGLFVALGVIGLIQLRKFRAAPPASPAPPPVTGSSAL